MGAKGESKKVVRKTQNVKDGLKVLMVLSNPLMVDPRVYKEAKTLAEAGYEVTVIVWDRIGEYEEESVVDGIKVIRVHNRGLMRILPNDLFRPTK